MRSAYEYRLELTRRKVDFFVKHAQEILAEKLQVGLLHVGKAGDGPFGKEDAAHGLLFYYRHGRETATSLHSPKRHEQEKNLPFAYNRGPFPPRLIYRPLYYPAKGSRLLAVRAKDINEAMKMAATRAIADCVSDDKLSADFILPDAFDRSVAYAVAKAVAQAAIDSGVAGLNVNPL